MNVPGSLSLAHASSGGLEGLLFAAALGVLGYRRARRPVPIASAVRGAVGQTLAKRQFDAPEDYARLQVARLTKALRCADVSLEEGDLKAIAPFLKVVRELNLYHGVNLRPGRPAPTTPPEIAPTSAQLALTHSPGVALTRMFEDEKSCAKEQLSS